MRFVGAGFGVPFGGESGTEGAATALGAVFVFAAAGLGFALPRAIFTSASLALDTHRGGHE